MTTLSEPATDPDTGPDLVDGPPATADLTVRASYPLYGVVAVGAGVLTVGFTLAALRSAGSQASWRWAAGLAFAVLAVLAIRALRAKPLLVADGTGIRLRVHSVWIGSRWDDIEQVVVLPRRHPLDDGRIAIHLEDPGPVLAAMDAATRKRTDGNRRLTGSSLAVPFGLAAVPSDPDPVAALQALADGRCPVVEQT